MTQQEAFTNCKDAWNAHMWLSDETAEWQTYCMMHPIHNYQGDKCYMFPYIAFLKSNIPRVMDGLGILFTPDW